MPVTVHRGAGLPGMTRVRVQEVEDLRGVKGPCSLPALRPWAHGSRNPVCARNVQAVGGSPQVYHTTYKQYNSAQLRYRCQTVALLSDCEGSLGSLRGWGCPETLRGPMALMAQ